MQILALLIAALIPIACLLMLYRLDLYHMGTFRYILACFFFGALAFGAAVFVNRTLAETGLLPRSAIIRFSAPLVEELLKALLLFYLVRRPGFTYFVDGAIYGFAAGIGFAVFENWQYILASPGPALDVALGRVLSTNLMHAAASGFVGAGFGRSRFVQAAGRRIALLAGGFAGAVLLHMAFNNLVDRLAIGLVVVFAILLGLGSALGIAWIRRRGLAEEKAWISETLGQADRVTGGEAAAVQRLEGVRPILSPIVERFGPLKAQQVERLLLLQAQIGIRRKTLQLLTDEALRQTVGDQLAQAQREMDAIRRQIGPYVMLYLRSAFPPPASPLWGRLEILIREQPASGSGLNLWATLEERTASQKEQENGYS